MRRINLPIIDIKKYRGRQVAIVDGKIVASGRSTQEILAKAQRKFPEKTLKDFFLLTVPRGLPVIYRLPI